MSVRRGVAANLPVLLILLLLGTGSILLQIFSGRQYVDESQRMYGGLVSLPPQFTVISRAYNSAILVLLFLVGILGRLGLPRVRAPLVLSVFFYYFCTYILSGVLGRYDGFGDIYSFISCFIMIFFLIYEKIPKEYLLRFVRVIIGIMVIGSLVCAVLFPDWAYSGDSYALGEDGGRRLIGLFGHPRALAVYALTLLTIEATRVSGSRLVRCGTMICCVVAIFLSVSKTAILLLPLVFILFSYVRYKRIGRNGAGFFVGAILLIVVLGSAIFEFSGVIEAFVSNNKESLSTFTGRSIIWNRVIESWGENPVFGNGVEFFKGGHMFGFAHAHNIFLQALSDGGVIGLCAMLFHVAVVFFLAVRMVKAGNMTAIGLVLIVFLFSISEPIVGFGGLYTGEFFIYLVVILYLGTEDKSRAALAKSS